MGTNIDVVAIVVLSVLTAIDGVGHAGPLSVVACAFNCTGHAAGLAKTLDIAHTATETHSIGSDNASMVALVCQCHTIELAIACVEVESTKIDPRASTHLLIHAELGTFSLVPDSI